MFDAADMSRAGHPLTPDPRYPAPALKASARPRRRLRRCGIPREQGWRIHRDQTRRDVCTRDLSKACHEAAAKEDSKSLASLETEIDKYVAKLWDITSDELKAIQEALAETRKSKRAAGEDAEE
jgi:hypothetical protein